jgi:peptidyl-tRNA hydrolase
MDKLFIVVRGDLAPGAQVAQSCHALRLFVAKYPEIDAVWYRDSNNLVCLQVPDESALERLIERVRAAGHPGVGFTEPDFDDALTAAAFGPTAGKLLSSLPCTLRPEKKAA